MKHLFCLSLVAFEQPTSLTETHEGSVVTYTKNWPLEPLTDNRPSGSIILWSVISFVVLLAGVGTRPGIMQ